MLSESTPLRGPAPERVPEEGGEDESCPISPKLIFFTVFWFLVLFIFIILNTQHTRAVVPLTPEEQHELATYGVLGKGPKKPKSEDKVLERKKRFGWNIHASAQNYYRFKDWILNTSAEGRKYTPIIKDTAYIMEMEEIIWPQVNMANAIFGATVDNELSSSNSLNTFFWGIQSGYVILDRPDPPKSTAWCSEEKTPVLTINLVNYSMPTSVSYQHSHWEGDVPNEAPKEYDVVACLNSNCTHKHYIARNCLYTPSQNQSGIEQSCPVLPTQKLDASLIKKVQFHFRKTHGKSKNTCVSLVRVYADDKSGIEKNETACEPMAAYYYSGGTRHRQIPGYSKDCVSIYKLNCCSACPLCCFNCKMERNFTDFILNVLMLTVATLVVFLIFISIVFTMNKYCKGDKIGYTRTV